jgi:hypothetical protein
MKKHSIVWIMMAVVIAVGLSAASCKRGPKATDTTTTTTDTTTTQTDTTTTTGTTLPSGLPDAEVSRPLLQAEVTKATQFIKALKDDSVLQLVSMKFVNSFADTTGLMTNYYIFRSPTDDRYYYLVNIPHNGESEKRFLMPKEDLSLPFSLLDVPFEYWKLSYVDALKLAETTGGGEAFRTAHAQWEASVILGRPAGQHLKWFITYRALDTSGATLEVAVDANLATVEVTKPQ